MNIVFIGLVFLCYRRLFKTEKQFGGVVGSGELRAVVIATLFLLINYKFISDYRNNEYEVIGRDLGTIHQQYYDLIVKVSSKLGAVVDNAVGD